LNDAKIKKMPVSKVAEGNKEKAEMGSGKESRSIRERD